MILQYIKKSRHDFAIIYKSSVDFPSETEAIDESCFDFIFWHGCISVTDCTKINEQNKSISMGPLYL